MKKYIFTWLFLWVWVSLSAQNRVVISGKVAYPKSDKVSFIFFEHFISYEPQMTSAQLNYDNTFSAVIYTNKPSFIQFRCGESADYTTIYAKAGDSIYVEADGQEWGSDMYFAGSHAAENIFLYSFQKEFILNKSYQIYPERYKKMDAREFRAFVGRVRKDELKYFEQYQKKNMLEGDFIDIIYSQINYGWANELFNYPIYHSYLNRGAASVQLPKNYYSFINELTLINEKALYNYEYTNFLHNVVKHIYKEEYAQTFSKRYPVSYTMQCDIARKVLKGKTLHHTIAMIISEGFQNGALQTLRKEYDQFMSNSPHDDYKKTLLSKYKRIQKLSSGNEAPLFVLNDTLDSPVALSDFRGKVVYLTFWDSSCEPCLKEIEASQSLKSAFEENGKNVVFMYISLDENTENWRKTIQQNEIAGVHLISTGYSSDAARLYELNALPAYFLIDQKGKIAYDRTKRPTQEGLEEDIDYLLKMK